MGLLIGTIVIGLIVGAIARFIMPGTQSMIWGATILLGITGSLAAGYGGQVLGIYMAGPPLGLIASVLGALALLFVGQKLPATVIGPILLLVGIAIGFFTLSHPPASDLMDALQRADSLRLRSDYFYTLLLVAALFVVAGAMQIMKAKQAQRPVA